VPEQDRTHPGPAEVVRDFRHYLPAVVVETEDLVDGG
jgi:hypothetical protein